MFQHQEGSVPGEGLSFSRSAAHERQGEERDRPNQTRADSPGFQEEQRWFHPPRSCQLRTNQPIRTQAEV